MTKVTKVFYIRTTETYLYAYRCLRAAIANAIEEIEEIKKEIILSCENTYTRLEQSSFIESKNNFIKDDFIYGDKEDGKNDVIIGMQQYIKPSSGHHSGSDPTATIAEIIMTHPRINRLKLEIEWTNNLLAKIDRVYEVLPELERNIIRLRYFEGRQWKEITEIVHLSERQARTWKNRAVRKIAVGLHGEKALRNMKKDEEE